MRSQGARLKSELLPLPAPGIVNGGCALGDVEGLGVALGVAVGVTAADGDVAAAGLDEGLLGGAALGKPEGMRLTLTLGSEGSTSTEASGAGAR